MKLKTFIIILLISESLATYWSYNSLTAPISIGEKIACKVALRKNITKRPRPTLFNIWVAKVKDCFYLSLLSRKHGVSCLRLLCFGYR